jgi:Uma2 family endonuclease
MDWQRNFMETHMSTIAKLSLTEYERIVASGVFDWPSQRHIELIRGELREMNPIGPDHAEVVDRLNEWSMRYVMESTVRVRVQNPLAFANVDSEPQPDIVWVRKKSYSSGHPAAADVLLVIEVAESSLDRDRTEKADLYAEVGIQEYWIVNLVDRTIEVYRDPASGHYRTVRTFAANEMAQPLALPEAGLSFDRLLRPVG